MRRIGMIIFLVMGAAPAFAGGSGTPDTAMPDLRARVADERARVDEFQRLQLEVERLKLELEKKKTLAEIGKVDGGGGGVDPAAGAQGFAGLRYVLIAGARKEAVFDIDGMPQRLGEGAGIREGVIKNISSDGVIWAAPDGRDMFIPVGK